MPSAAVTRVRDLVAAGTVPDDTFDCVILDQALHLTDDVPAALANSRRGLRADGVLLLSVPGTAGPVHGETGAGMWHRGFTELSVRRLLGECFRPDAFTVAAHGNVLTATALLQGLAADELSDEELSFDDPQFPVIIVARARKVGDERPDPSVPAKSHRPAVRA
jgi:SAM-dependent methyltransferase